MKKMNFKEAHEMLENKRGAGKRKLTKIHLDMDIQFMSGLPGAASIVEMLPIVISSLVNHESVYSGYDREAVVFNDNSSIETEHEDNEEWK